MGGDPRQDGGVNFAKKATQLAVLCQKTGDEKLYTGFMASIPIGDDAVENSQKTTWSCIKCKKIFKTPNRHKKHQDACKKDKSIGTDNTDRQNKENNNQQNPNITKKGATFRQKQCIFCKNKRVRIQDHYFKVHKLDYHRVARNLSERDNQRYNATCFQCNEDFFNEDALDKHLLDYHNIKLKAKTVRLLLRNGNKQEHAASETEAIRRDLQRGNIVQNQRENIESDSAAQEEMETGSSARERETGKPITQNHAASEVAAVKRKTEAIRSDIPVEEERGNIESGPAAQEEMETGSFIGERETGNPNTQNHVASEVAAAQRETEAIRSDFPVEEERGNIESGPNAQEEMETGPSAEERETRNQYTHGHAKRVVIQNTQICCHNCQKFVDCSLFASHIALHEREREGYPFQTKRVSTRSVANRQTGSLSHLNETVENIGPYMQDGRVAPNNGAMDQREARNNINTLRNETGSVNAEEIYNGQDYASILEDISEENVSQVAETSEELSMQVEIDEIDVERKKSEMKRWRHYFNRMRCENLENQAKLYEEYAKLRDWNSRPL